MRLDLFSKNDTVLLLGEGNFSFSVCLHKHKLPIKITATCFEKEPLLEDQQENVKYLKSKEVPVFYNVDATKLHKNLDLWGKNFSKIIFNFPHSGGKMKIHLNRQLLRESFESSSQIISDGGIMIVTLCQGQGGTPADNPQRRWDDSWQITEMAAHGDFILTAVEPFDSENFKDYRCTGYRSQNVGFNLKGALVHIFVKRKSLNCMSIDNIIDRLSLVPLKENSVISVPVVYSELYEANPLLNSNSPVSFLRDLLVKAMLPTETKILTDDDIPLYVKSQKGVRCEVKSQENQKRQYSLCCDAMQVLPEILQKLDDPESKTILFPGLCFNPNLDLNFLNAPINFQFIIVGDNLFSKVVKYISDLIEIFKEMNLSIAFQSLETTSYINNVNTQSRTELVCENKQLPCTFVAATVYSLGSNLEVCIINIDSICNYFFKVTDWREIWAEETKVINVNEKPVLKLRMLYPSEYKFDLTLKFNTKNKYSEEKMYEILWFAAGRMIQQVELVNHYTSDKEWSSRCYRITYKSLDLPLYRSRAIDIHSEIVGRMLAIGLGVDIS